MRRANLVANVPGIAAVDEVAMAVTLTARTPAPRPLFPGARVTPDRRDRP